VTEAQDVFTIDSALYDREVDIARQGYYVAAARHADLQAGFRPEEVRRFEQEVVAAREQLDFATRDRDRTKELWKAGSLSRESFEKAELAYVAAKTRLDNAENQLKIGKEGATRTQLAVAAAAEREAHARMEHARSRRQETRIAAPFSGTITRVHARPGDNASPRGPLVDLVDLSQLVVRFSVPESQAAGVRLKQKVLVSLDAFPGQEVSGEIERVHPTLDPRSRVLWVEARLGGELRLIPGMFARIRLVIEELADQVVVPEAAVFLRGGSTRVVVVDQKKARIVTVKVGHRSAGAAQILEGLEPGQELISENPDQYRDGQAVEVLSNGGGPGMGAPDMGAGSMNPMKE
jgi:membrane fusion protein (multidrug efflux system)